MLPEPIFRQLEIERIGIAEDGSMVRLPGPNPEPIPRLAVYRHPGGFVALFREDVAPDERERVRGLGDDRAFADTRAVEAVLGPAERGHFRTYVFEKQPAASYAGVVEEDRTWSVYKDGVRASRAFSSREGPRAAELAVETAPAFRRRGFARRAASAWVAAKLGEGKLAFYSHAVENRPSESLAASLGLTECFEVVTYT